MRGEAVEIRYASGEVARVGDRVEDDGQDAVVEDVYTRPEVAELMGEDGVVRKVVREPGLSLLWDLGLPVFRPVTSAMWRWIKFKGRAGET
jgi:hypothetical protein